MPHAGFGLGFERTLAYVTGLAKHARRHPLPNDARECEVLMHTTLAIAVSCVDPVSGPPSQTFAHRKIDEDTAAADLTQLAQP